MAYLLVLIFFAFVNGDVYLHNPRGSNNRLNEGSRERDNPRVRNNANRLFNSQNSDRGGYNAFLVNRGVKQTYGPLYYYAGSQLAIEWTMDNYSPHVATEVVLQYMCSESLRDGTITASSPYPRQSNLDERYERYGQHEDYQYYQGCVNRQRNKGLYTADQNLEKEDARSTRQNPSGSRRGHECPEERDYYPYWHPTPWKDIAILTNHPDDSQCAMYKSLSQNVNSRFKCVPSDEGSKKKMPITQAECGTSDYREWTEVPGFGTGSPVCKDISPHVQDEGDLVTGIFKWTVPDDVNENCALRLRYNISAADHGGWSAGGKVWDSAKNKEGVASGVADVLAQRYAFSPTEARERGYNSLQNPEVRVLSYLPMKLAVNTAQYGRTFQDRSHAFAIRRRPDELAENKNIHNVNVRGKAGDRNAQNDVVVYPGVEVGLAPNTLNMEAGDYVHFQWTDAKREPINHGRNNQNN